MSSSSDSDSDSELVGFYDPTTDNNPGPDDDDDKSESIEGLGGKRKRGDEAILGDNDDDSDETQGDTRMITPEKEKNAATNNSSTALTVITDNQMYRTKTWGVTMNPAGKKTNRWWQFFWSWSNPMNDRKAHQWPQCRGCHMNVGISKKLAPRALQNHAEKCEKLLAHPEYKAKIHQFLGVTNPSASASSSGNQTSMDSYVDKHTLFKQKATEYVVMDYLPLSTVTSPSFRRLMSAANTNLPIIGKDSIRADIKRAHYRRIAKQTELLKNQDYCITHDAWTSTQNIGYTALTIHFIDAQWKLNSFPLACAQAKGRATAIIIVSLIKELLSNYKLTLNDCVAVTTDTCATMQSSARIMQQDVSNAANGTIDLIVFQPCVAHTFELTAKVPGANTHLNSNAIKASRNFVKTFKKSTQLAEALEATIKTVDALKDRKVCQYMNLIMESIFSLYILSSPFNCCR
jgi:hypothetical protein